MARNTGSKKQKTKHQKILEDNPEVHYQKVSVAKQLIAFKFWLYYKSQEGTVGWDLENRPGSVLCWNYRKSTFVQNNIPQGSYPKIGVVSICSCVFADTSEDS